MLRTTPSLAIVARKLPGPNLASERGNISSLPTSGVRQSQASSSGTCCWPLSLIRCGGPSATRTRAALKRALSFALVPVRQLIAPVLEPVHSVVSQLDRSGVGGKVYGSDRAHPTLLREAAPVTPSPGLLCFLGWPRLMQKRYTSGKSDGLGQFMIGAMVRISKV